MPWYQGQQVFSVVPCPDCGKSCNASTNQNSGFFIVSCHNSECVSYLVGALIEKSSMMVINVNGIYIDGKVAFPATYVDREGNVVWPKPTKPVDGVS